MRGQLQFGLPSSVCRQIVRPWLFPKIQAGQTQVSGYQRKGLPFGLGDGLAPSTRPRNLPFISGLKEGLLAVKSSILKAPFDVLDGYF